MKSVDVIEVYKTLTDLGIRVWIDGGWGVDALLGRQTRSHKDLDIAIEDQQLLQFEQFLASRGYHRIKREIERPFNFVLADPMVVGSASAQTPTSKTSGAGAGHVDPGHPRANQINQREADQQKRIANGVKTAKLTPRQTARLERGEQRLQKNEERDMAKDNGHLTTKDQRQLNREANHMSKRIAADKHSAK
jgi:Aminoglycoside-2''-adenylyltransferase